MTLALLCASPLHRVEEWAQMATMSVLCLPLVFAALKWIKHYWSLNVFTQTTGHTITVFQFKLGLSQYD